MDMEMMFMSAGVVVAIVLCLVGIIKLPFGKFKEKHPQGFKTVFTVLTFILAIGLCVVDEMYILCGELLSIDFGILVCVVLAGVFSGYNGVYEGLGLKELVKKIVESLQKARDIAQNKKVVEYLNKIDDIDMAISILEGRKTNNQSK